MHYYKRNIGDYAKKAGRLTMLQHGAYTLLLDACYDREQFPTREEAIDWLWASSTAEIEAVDFVLSKFFNLVDGRFVQNRIQEELAEYHEKSLNNKRIAQEREAKRREKSTKRAPVVNETPPNQEPITNNQEPITNNQEPITNNQEPITKEYKADKPQEAKASRSVEQVLKPDSVDEQTWQDFKKLRTANKAPLTKTALTKIEKQAQLAGYTLEQALQTCCERGWRGFDASWVIGKPFRQNGKVAPAPENFADKDYGQGVQLI